MDSLRQRFAALDRVAVPDLRPEVDRRVAALADRPSAAAVRPRVRWGSRHAGQATTLGTRRFASVPALLLLALLVAALIASLTIGAGWWEQTAVLVPPSTQPPRPLVPTGDCPGAVNIEGEAPPFRGWVNGPQPGFLASVHPGRITALWNEPQIPAQPPSAPPLRQVAVVEVDPVSRTMCRLLTPIKTEQTDLLDAPSVPDANWTGRGDVLAIFRGDVETDDGCCAPGELIVSWPGSHSVLGSFDRDIGSVVWSNRGAWLAVNSAAPVHDWADVGPHTISLFPADGQPPHDVRFECDPCAYLAAAFSPDDTQLAVTFWRVSETGTTADELIAVADVATGTGVVLDVGPTNLSPLGWRDDRTILAVDEGRRLLAIPIDAPANFSVVAEFPLQLGVEAWSPDRSRVAYVRQTTNPPTGGELVSTDIFVLDVATGTTRHVVREVDIAAPFIWAPDNRTFAYTTSVNPDDPSLGEVLSVADALEGEPVSIAIGLGPIAWRPVWH